MKHIYYFLFILFLPVLAVQVEARPLSGLIDSDGNIVHTADEFILHVATVVIPDPQGYRYTYHLTSGGMSNQSIWWFIVFVDDASSIVKDSSISPWGVGAEPSPRAKKAIWARGVRWSSDPDGINPPALPPGQTLSGFTFLSPYPPGIIQAYSEGFTNSPWFADVPLGGAPEYSENTPYGPGKVFPVIGPVKPAGAVAGVPASNITVQSCSGATCTVQIDATGPMDPYGTAYTYTWSGPFGTATGAQPVVQMPVGVSQVGLSVSDPYATLVTATIEVNVVDPNSARRGRDEDGDDHGEDEGDDGHDRKKQKKHEKEDRHHH